MSNGIASRRHEVTVGDYMRNALNLTESAAYSVKSLYEVGVPDTSEILDVAENLAVMIRRWLEEND